MGARSVGGELLPRSSTGTGYGVLWKTMGQPNADELLLGRFLFFSYPSPGKINLLEIGIFIES